MINFSFISLLKNKISIPHLFIFALVLAAHFQLLMVGGVRWDDILLYKIYERRDYGELYAWMMEMGLPLNYLFFRSVMGLFGYSSHNILSFLCIFFSALAIYKYIITCLDWGKSDALLFVALFITCMPFKSTPLFSTLQYQFCLLLFLLGAIICEQRFKGDKFLPLLFSTVLFFLSFNTGSFLVFIYFYLCISFLKFYRDGENKFLRALSIWLQKTWVILLVPFLYFFIKLKFFPTYGPYENYNKINISYDSIAYSFRWFKEALLINPLTYIKVYSELLYWLTLGIAILLPVLLAFTSPSRSKSTGSAVKAAWYPWTVPFLAIVFALLPYSLIGITPRPVYWESRHLLLFCIALPIVLFKISNSIGGWLSRLVSEHLLANFSRSIVMTLCIIYCSFGYLHYFVLQLGEIKQLSIISNLKHRDDLKRLDYFSVIDNVADFSGNKWRLYEANHDVYYTWAYLFTEAWGEERWFGYSHDEFRKDKPYRSKRYGTSMIKPDGKWCTIELSLGTELSPWQIYYRHYYYKLFKYDAFEAFSRSLVSVSRCLEVGDKNFQRST